MTKRFKSRDPAVVRKDVLWPQIAGKQLGFSPTKNGKPTVVYSCYRQIIFIFISCIPNKQTSYIGFSGNSKQFGLTSIYLIINFYCGFQLVAGLIYFSNCCKPQLL
jgi:hypothetical protein